MMRDKAYRRVARVSAMAASAALAFGLLLATSQKAVAGTAQYNGAQPATITGGDIFNVNGDTVTITGAATPTYLSINGGGKEQLIGVSGIWIVTPSGGTEAGVTTLTGGGQVSGANPLTNWTAESGPAGYGGTTGYSPNGTWIDLVDNTTLSHDGKSTDGFDTGTFDFSGLSGLTGYDFGIDYMIANSDGRTTTGRAYFSVPHSVPEPGTVTTLSLAGFGLAALALTARRRSQKAL